MWEQQLTGVQFNSDFSLITKGELALSERKKKKMTPTLATTKLDRIHYPAVHIIPLWK